MILGNAFYAYKKMSAITPTSLSDGKNVKVENGMFKELFATRNSLHSINDTIPDQWDLDTIMHVIFKNGITAGNIEYAVANSTDVLIKRRIKGTFDWDIIAHYPITQSSDFYKVIYDKYNQSGVTYEYAFVPVNVDIEGTYSTVDVDSSFDGMYLVESDSVYSCLLDLSIDRQRNKPSSSITTLNNKFPTYISNTKQQYDSGNVDTSVFEYVQNEVTELYDFDTTNAWEYRDKFLDFLTDGKAKVLKTFDGKFYIVKILDNPTEKQGEYWNKPKTSFSWVQVGSVSNEYLYKFGLLDIDSKWWRM